VYEPRRLRMVHWQERAVRAARVHGLCRSIVRSTRAMK
jgi:hypothetical protein